MSAGQLRKGRIGPNINVARLSRSRFHSGRVMGAFRTYREHSNDIEETPFCDIYHCSGVALLICAHVF
jgi:hypothetical protein